MKYNEIRYISRRQDFNPVILSYADNTHYLVGNQIDEKNYDIAIDKKGSPVCFHCLADAKGSLKSAGCSHARLIIQTPYDEMIGHSCKSDCIMEIDL